MIIISAVGALFLTLPAVFGDFLQNFLDPSVCKNAGKLLLFALGALMLAKHFMRDWGKDKKYPLCVCIDESKAKKADCNCDRNLSGTESLVLGIGLSADSIVTGFSAGLSGMTLKNAVLMFFCVFLLSLFSVEICHSLGKKLSEKTNLKIGTALAGGIIMIILSIFI